MTTGLEVDFGAQLCASLDGLAAIIDADRAERRKPRVPYSVSRQNGPVTPAGFSFTSAQGLAGYSPPLWGPVQGYYWAVQRITVAGLAAAVAGSADAAAGTVAAATAGSASLPHATDFLTGFTISLSTVGTAAMTVTVSNVSGGPYVYTIPIGAQVLTITYPQPVPSTGIAPQVAWSATAAAVGNVSVYGLTAATAQDSLTIYRGRSAASAQPQNALQTLVGNNGYSQYVHIGGDGIMLHPDDGLCLLGTALASANYYVNVDVIQITSDRIHRIAPEEG